MGRPKKEVPQNIRSFKSVTVVILANAKELGMNAPEYLKLVFIERGVK
jgi:hypothetical protein